MMHMCSSLPVLSTFPSLCFAAVSSIVRDFSAEHVTRRGQANIKLRGLSLIDAMFPIFG